MTMVGPATRQEIDPALVARLHARAKASRWGVAAGRFGEVLAKAATKRFPTGPGGFPGGDPGATALAEFLEHLHLEDLALAIGCADGDDGAWEAFVGRYRAELTRAAV